jgi:hypothetical protein
VTKSAALLGIGINNIIYVKSDKIGKMIPEELDREINAAKEKVNYVYIHPALANRVVILDIKELYNQLMTIFVY